MESASGQGEETMKRRLMIYHDRKIYGIFYTDTKTYYININRTQDANVILIK